MMLAKAAVLVGLLWAMCMLAPGGAMATGSAITVDERAYVQSQGSWFEVTSGGLTPLDPYALSVVFEDDAAPDSARAVIDRLGASVARLNSRGTYDLHLPEGADVIACLQTFFSHDLVNHAEPSLVASFCAQPTDRLWTEQWNLAEHRVDALHAWEIETGDTSKVLAVIDAGVNIGHSDIRGNLWRNWDEIPFNQADDDSNSYVDDYWGWNFESNTNHVDDIDADGHGSCVAGLACALTNNDTTGIAGVAGGWCDTTWTSQSRGNGCLSMTLRISGLSSEVDDAIYYAVDNGANVINMSFAWGEVPPLVEAAIDTAVKHGLILVAATGNGAQFDIGYPASDDDVIAVGATYRDDRVAYFSRRGSELDVVAPSGPCTYVSDSCNPDTVESVSCEDAWYPEEPPGCAWYPRTLHQASPPDTDRYTYLSGTSAACPQVAALAALLTSFDPTLTTTDVRCLIRYSSEDLIGDASDLPGWDDHYGYGRINAYSALFLARGGGETASNLRLCYDVEFDRDVKVSDGDTLEFLPGVTITFAGGSDAANLGVDETHCELIVEGALIAEGDPGDYIRFTASSDSAGAWYGIRVAEGGEVELRYCDIENAYKGVTAEAPGALELAQLSVEDCVAHGIYCEDCDSSAKIDTCTIDRPGLLGIEVRDSGGFTVRGNGVTDATAYGIKCCGGTDMAVEDNTVVGHAEASDFVGIYYKPAAGDTSYVIEGNTVTRCGSRGISCEHGTFYGASVGSNTVSDNGYSRGTVGVHFYRSRAKMRETTVEKKSTGVVAIVGGIDPEPIPNLGLNTEGECGNNRFMDNSNWYVWALGLSSGDTLRAEMNWYGSQDPDPNKFASGVDWTPHLTEDPGGAGRVVPPESTRPDVEVEYMLSQNCPNPFNPATSIEYGVLEEGHVSLNIYDAAGRLVRTLVGADRTPGYYVESWNGTDEAGRRLASGIYFCRLEVGGTERVQKLVLLK